MDHRLHKFPLFAGLDAAAVDRLTSSFSRRTFRRGERLVRQGAKDPHVYLLVEGKVEVQAEAKDGSRLALLFHAAPSIFGQMEIWQERPMLGNVVAMEPCTAVIISRKSFLTLLHSHHQVAINLSRMLSQLLYRVAQDRRVRMFGRVEHLVANTLGSYAQLFGEEHRYGVLVRKDINKTEIASLLGVNRRSVIRAFAELQKEGLIRMDGRQLVIPDPEALRKKATSPFPEAW